MGTIRVAIVSDLDRINEIYNQAVSNKFQTADTMVSSIENRTDWFLDNHDEQYPVWVYESEDSIVGWVTLSKYRNGRPVLKNTAEVSYYVDEHHQGKGLGTELLRYAIDLAKNLGYKNLFAMLLEPNIASIGLLKKFGFQEWGRIPGAAEIDGQRYDHLYYGLQIDR